jgi:hypothetical protein
LGDRIAIIHALGALGHVAREMGDYAGASVRYRESLAVRRELEDASLIALSLEDFAILAGRQKQHERAARLLGAAEALCQTLGRTPPLTDPGQYAHTVDSARDALGEEAFAAAWEKGRAMSLERMVEYALS